MNIKSPPTAEVTFSHSEKLLKICKGVSLALVAITFALGALAFSNSSKDNGNYLILSPLSAFFYATLVTDVVFTLFLLIIFRKAGRVKSEDKKANFLSLLPAAAATYCLVSLSANTDRGVLDVLIMISAALSILFCVSKIAKISDVLTVLSGYGQVFFGIFIVAHVYLDHSIELNSPAKLLLLFSSSLMTFSVLSDLRYTLGRNNAAHFICFRFLAACLSPVAFVAILNVSATNNGEIKKHLCFGIFLLSYALCEMIRLLLATYERPTDPQEQYRDPGAADSEKQEQDTI